MPDDCKDNIVMPMSHEEWIDKVHPYLDKIAAGAHMAERNVEALVLRPDFVTMAQVDLETCAMALREALTLIERAQAIYQDKEIDT